MMPADKRDDSPRCGYGRSRVDFGRNFLRCEAVISVVDHGVSRNRVPRTTHAPEMASCLKPR